MGSSDLSNLAGTGEVLQMIGCKDYLAVGLHPQILCSSQELAPESQFGQPEETVEVADSLLSRCSSKLEIQGLTKPRDDTSASDKE
jgi:hypothetical protein